MILNKKKEKILKQDQQDKKGTNKKMNYLVTDTKKHDKCYNKIGKGNTNDMFSIACCEF